MPYITRIPGERRSGEQAWTGREIELCWLNEPRRRGNTSSAPFVIELPRPEKKECRLGFLVKRSSETQPIVSGPSSLQQAEAALPESEAIVDSGPNISNPPSYSSLALSTTAIHPLTPEGLGAIMGQIAALEAAGVLTLDDQHVPDHNHASNEAIHHSVTQLIYPAGEDNDASEFIDVEN
ncbi:hypothetical protein FRC12_011875 [Ceratobasidium sp. 428]|nr:hypothetical protein FRC12_011875 [Ceratobasidium sp. 428]